MEEATHSGLVRLRDMVEAGLGPHHDVEGRCTVRVADAPALDCELSLTPGSVALGPPTASPRGTLKLTTGVLELLLRGVPFDFREPEFAQALSFEGDLEFVVRAIVLSLRRPTDAIRRQFEFTEEMSRLNVHVAELKEVARVERPSLSEFGDRLQRGVPFIVTGALDAWSAATSFEGWAQRRAALAMQMPTGDTTTLGDFLREAPRRRDVLSYTHGMLLPDGLREDFPPPAYGQLGTLTPAQLWLGAGSDPQTPVTTLHRDAMTGLLGHLYGRKRFTVFPPHQSDCLYVRPGFDSYQHCWAAPHKPNDVRYPKLREATPIDFVLGPGELLVQPAGWFHCVYALDPIVASVSYFLG